MASSNEQISYFLTGETVEWIGISFGFVRLSISYDIHGTEIEKDRFNAYTI